MDTLPRDALYEILVKLDEKDILSMCQTSRKYAKVSRDDYFWSLKANRDPQLSIPMQEFKNKFSYITHPRLKYFALKITCKTCQYPSPKLYEGYCFTCNSRNKGITDRDILPCPDCGRNFTLLTLTKHENRCYICSLIARKKF